MFALKCRRNYAISAESISISQSNIVLIVTAVINLICSGEPTLLPRTFPSCTGQFGAVCFLREELFLQQAGSQAQATGQGVQFSALLLPTSVTLNTMLWPQLTHLWNGDGLHCPMAMWRSMMPSSMTPLLLRLCHGARQPETQETCAQHIALVPWVVHIGPGFSGASEGRYVVGFLQSLQDTELGTSCSTALCSSRCFCRLSLHLVRRTVTGTAPYFIGCHVRGCLKAVRSSGTKMKGTA